jgi:hypothetical protein
MRDVVLIVVSIIIAFAVDAWWDELGEKRQEQDHLAALFAEFEVVRQQLDAQLFLVARSRGATEEILRLTGPSPPHVAADSIAGLINDSFNVGVFASAGGALQALLASGGLSLIQSDSLSALLAAWPSLRASIAANEEILVLNREEEIQDYLVQAGVPISRVASNLDWLDIPQTKFDLDAATLLSSVEMESMFVTRIIRLTLLNEAYTAAQEHVSKILRFLDLELD